MVKFDIKKLKERLDAATQEHIKLSKSAIEKGQYDAAREENAYTAALIEVWQMIHNIEAEELT